ncbi:hypothetical protein BST45_16390 [Mycobacterium shinjukuense]|nr:hypothetical protein BST45_16390 [Mycobacterium shinjukuense]
MCDVPAFERQPWLSLEGGQNLSEHHDPRIFGRDHPPARSTLASSMLSAPHIIPPMIEVSLPAGLTAPEATRVDGRCACSCRSAAKDRSAQPVPAGGARIP